MSKRVPGVIDVAALAGVAIGTVSNALNNPEKVAPATLARVQTAIEKLGYVPNGNARNLVRGTSGAIGLSVIDLSNTLFVDIARGAQDAAKSAGMHVILTNADNDFGLQDKNLEFLDGARVDGMLLAPMQDSSASIDRVRRHGRPVVVLNYDSGDDQLCSVLIDNEEVGFLAARHLIDLGRTRLAFVGGRDDLQPVRLRRRGVKAAIAMEFGRVALEELTTADLNLTGGLATGHSIAMRSDADRPDGVIAVTDFLGMGIIEVLTEHRISVPDQIAVMGCDYNSAAWAGPVPLTTVHMQGYEMGRESTRLLLSEITMPDHEHEKVVLSPTLAVRESTVGRGRGNAQDSREAA